MSDWWWYWVPFALSVGCVCISVTTLAKLVWDLDRQGLICWCHGKKVGKCCVTSGKQKGRC